MEREPGRRGEKHWFWWRGGEDEGGGEKKLCSIIMRKGLDTAVGAFTHTQ